MKQEHKKLNAFHVHSFISRIYGCSFQNASRMTSQYTAVNSVEHDEDVEFDLLECFSL